ncbi:hypothetical protein AC1031_003535 [Aphanomyces cochlioides]|nr:hypothetical protein AC1031_003535 [Aphanomyces cochlioides]
MFKRARRETCRDRLPVELVLRIAFFLPDPSTYFTYIQAVASIVPDFACSLRALRQTHATNALWSQLHLRDFVDATNPCMEIAAKHYPVIQLGPSFADVQYLRRFVPQSADIHISSLPCRKTFGVPSTAAYFEHLAHLPIAKITLPETMSSTMDTTPLVDILPRLTKLTSLTISFDTVPMRFLEFLSTSRLTSLNLTIQGANATSDDLILEHLTQWLQRQPVEALHLYWDELDGSPQKSRAFFMALSNAKALTQLFLTPFDQALAVPTFRIPPTVADLGVGMINFSRRSEAKYARLGRRLASSNVTRLSITQDIAPSQCRSLIAALPSTNVTELILEDVDLCDDGCAVIADGFAATRLTTINLSTNELSNSAAHSLSLALLASERPISAIHLDNNLITRTGLRTLLKATVARSFPTHYFSMTGNKVDRATASRLRHDLGSLTHIEC